MNHKILLVGSGAREHAIAKTLKRSNQSNEVFCIGSNMNPGIEKICSKIIIQDCNNLLVHDKFLIGQISYLRKVLRLLGQKKILPKLKLQKASPENC